MTEPSENNILWRKLTKEKGTFGINMPLPDNPVERKTMVDAAEELHRLGLADYGIDDTGLGINLTEEGRTVAQRYMESHAPQHHHRYERAEEPDDDGCYAMTCCGETIGRVRPCRDDKHRDKWEFQVLTNTGWRGWTGHRTSKEKAFDKLKEKHNNRLRDMERGRQQKAQTQQRKQQTGSQPARKKKPQSKYSSDYLRSRPTKAMPVEIEQHADPGEPYDFTYSEKRWVIVDAETGEILDDAQGYGYKSAAGAHRAFGYKTASKEVKRRRETAKRLVERFERKHKNLMDDLDAMSFYAAKDGEEMTDQDILDCFAEHGVNLDDEGFTLKEFLKYW